MKKDCQMKKKMSLEKYLSRADQNVLSAGIVFGIGMILTAFMGKFAVWWLSIPVYLMYGVHWKNMIGEKEKIRFYKGMEIFVENLQMFYGYYGDIKEAVYDSMISAGKQGYEVGKKLDLYLRGAFKDSQLETCDPREIQLLEIGRCTMNGETNSFSTQESLRYFKEELREEIFRLEETRIQYSGLAEVCLLPVLTIPVLVKWATIHLEELNDYYKGIQGVLSSVLVLVLAGVVFFFLTKFHFEKQTIAREKRELSGEILRFHNWILLQKNSKEANVEKLLEGFLCLAGGLKRKVERLHYDYMEKGSEAIARAREQELCMPYVRILEGLMLCDKVSMEIAFSNIETERAFQLEKLKNENRKNIREKTALGKVLAFLPLYCVSVFFLIIPFVMEGLGRLQAYTESFGTLLY